MVVEPPERTGIFEQGIVGAKSVAEGLRVDVVTPRCTVDEPSQTTEEGRPTAEVGGVGCTDDVDGAPCTLGPVAMPTPGSQVPRFLDTRRS